MKTIVAVFSFALIISSSALAAEISTGSGEIVQGLQTAPKEALQPAGPLELALGGVSLTEQQFYSLARRTFFRQDWVVITASGGVVVAKKNASHFFGFGTTPVNDRLQWDEERKSFVYRVELKLEPDKIAIRYLPNWGSTGEKLLHELRRELAINLYQ